MESLGTGAEGGKAPFTFFSLFLSFSLFSPFSFPLFVVIRLPFYNGACAIERFGEDEPHHLVGECHL